MINFYIRKESITRPHTITFSGSNYAPEVWFLFKNDTDKRIVIRDYTMWISTLLTHNLKYNVQMIKFCLLYQIDHFLLFVGSNFKILYILSKNCYRDSGKSSLIKNFTNELHLKMIYIVIRLKKTWFGLKNVEKSCNEERKRSKQTSWLHIQQLRIFSDLHRLSTL